MVTCNPTQPNDRSALLCLGVIVLMTTSACQAIPFSGRNQQVLIPEQQETAMAHEAYREILAGAPPSQNQAAVEMVRRVGERLAAVSERPDDNWEFHVIASPRQHAFALAGGKVALHEGLLPICQNEAGLAVVLSHQIAHAIARHGGERMGHQTVAGRVRGLLDFGDGGPTSELRTLVSGSSPRGPLPDGRGSDQHRLTTAYGASAQSGVVPPYSRKQESEADAIGLILMAKAGYDPREAPAFWERFASLSGPHPPELLSTHPTDARRAADLRQLVAEAVKYYEASPQQYALGEPVPPVALQQLADRERGGEFGGQKRPAGLTPASPADKAGPASIHQLASGEQTTGSSQAINRPSFQEPLVIDSPTTATDPHVITTDGWGPSSGQTSLQ